MDDVVIRAAQQAHKRHWVMSGHEGTGDRLAARVTAEWQNAVVALDTSRFKAEYQISLAPMLRQRIDLVDVLDGVAYELKVSPNNVHMEFYRDIFKVILARDKRLPNLRKFVFLTPESAAGKMNAGMGKAVIDDASRYGLLIEVVGI